MTKRKTAIPKRTRPAKLNQREKEGVRLIAELFVVREIQQQVFAKDEVIKPHLNQLEKALKRAAPKVFAAESELQRQVKLIRNEWLRLLQEKKHG